MHILFLYALSGQYLAKTETAGSRKYKMRYAHMWTLLLQRCPVLSMGVPCPCSVAHLQHTKSATESAWHVPWLLVRDVAKEKGLLHLKTLVIQVFRLDSVDKACK